MLFVFQKDLRSGGISMSPAFHIVQCLRQFLYVPHVHMGFQFTFFYDRLLACGDHHTDVVCLIMVDHHYLQQKEPHVVSFDVLYDACVASPQAPCLQTVHIESVTISILGWGNLGCVPTWCTKQHLKWKHPALFGSFMGLWWAASSPQAI